MNTSTEITNLLSQVQLFAYPSGNVGDEIRFSISAGTVRTSDQAGLSETYLDNTFIPREPWREPSNQEVALLWAGVKKLDPRCNVGIISIPNEIIEPFYQLEIGSLPNQDAILSALQAPDSLAAIQPIEEYIKQFCTNPEIPMLGGLNVKQPNLRTVSANRQSQFVGLHIDSWDGLPLTERGNSRVRISVNLGIEDRYLLFINLTATSLFQLLVTAPNDQRNNTWQGKVGLEFMARYPQYPVVKVKIRPGEAYIAPTENIIHEGSTEGKQHYDIVLSELAHFTLP